MSDTPSPTPDALKPKLSLAPKATAAPADASAAAPANSGLEVNPAHPNQASSNVTPPGLAASIAASGAAGAAPRPAFKLQGAVHPANPDKFADQKFTSPIPAAADDTPSIAVVALSAIAAVAAITFAALLFLKNQ